MSIYGVNGENDIECRFLLLPSLTSISLSDRPARLPSTATENAPERDQLIAQLAGEGKSNEEIAIAVGLSERQVTRILYRLGFRRGRGRPAK